jgi:integrase
MTRKPKQQAVQCQFFTWHLRQRDGVFYADARGGKYNLGKFSLGTRDRQEALDALRQLDLCKAVEIGLTAAAASTADNDISIADGWKRYLDHSGRSQVLGGASAGTLKRYKSVRDKHFEFCARRGISTWVCFDKSALERYGNHLSKLSADRTVFLELTLLKSVAKWLIGEKLLPRGAELEYPLRKPQGTDTHCYSRAEVAAMVGHCQAKPKLVWLAHVIQALAMTGMRIGELAALRWSDVDLVRGFIRVADERASRRKRLSGTARTTKGRKSRNIPIHATLKAVLIALPRHPDGLVLHAAQGGKLRPRNVLEQLLRHAIKPLADRFPTPPGDNGFANGTVHGLRHFFCSEAFISGASEGDIREWLGHADSKMVEHYRHLRSEDAQRKMDQIQFFDRPEQHPGDVA